MKLNILGIVDENGQLVVKYDCDAFGNKVSITDTSGINLGVENPFRCKGYYYDDETSLFWLSSRYYSPELCRWISPDSIEYLDPESINGLNLYAYCNNDPINKYDPSGCFAISLGIFFAITMEVLKDILIATAAVLTISAVVETEKTTHVIENTVNQITNEIKDFTDKISFVIEDYVYGLTINDKYDKVEYHHIVAKKDPRALISRVILIKSGIDVNDSINMVWVNKNYHKVLHTNTYYGIVNTSMFMAYLIGGEKGVKSTLFLYQKILGGL